MVNIVVTILLFSLAAFYLARAELRRGLRSYRSNKVIESDTAVEPAAVSPGETTVVGTVAANRTLELPIGDEERCVAYYLDMFLGPNDRSWPYEDRTRAVPFRLEDGEASVRVDPENVAVEPTADRWHRYSNSILFDENPEDLPERLCEFLDEQDVPLPEGFGGVKYEQKYVAVGDTACVHGVVEKRNGEFVLTDHEGDFFVTDKPPAEFLTDRPSILKITLKEAGIFSLIGVALLLGLVVLATG